MTTVLSLKNVGKEYRLGSSVATYATLRDRIVEVCRSLVPRGRHSSEQGSDERSFWALRNVTFDVSEGEVVGFIGRNGAGKSTLLKAISRITEPTTGTIAVWGRVGSLLEVGTGFHPELSGRENIFLNGAILGMKRSEIRRSFDSIVEFAGIERFLDTPVKRYSSGMYIRLAFAVAAHLEPEILIVDEVLAVGDSRFQRKCLGKMGEIADSGRTVIFVSHNMAAVSSLCTKAMVIDGGEITFCGSPSEAIGHYLDSSDLDARKPLSERVDRRGNGRVRFTNAKVLSAGGVVTETVLAGESVTVRLEYELKEGGQLSRPSFSVGFYSQLGQFLFFCGNEMTGAEFGSLAPSGSVDCVIGELPLSPGTYELNVNCDVDGQTADWIPRAVVLTVVGGDFFGSGKLPPEGHGGLLVRQNWSVAS